MVMDLGRNRTDHALATRIAAGDDHAFELLGARHRPRLLRFASGRLGDRRDEAEDVVQDALLRAYRALHDGKVPEHVSAWLHTIVANCASDRHQSAGRRPTVELHEEAAELPGSVDPHAAAVRRAEVESTVHAIAALPEAQRRAFVGYELEGRTYADLGHEHGWSLSATKSLLWRARDNLQVTRTSWGAVGGMPLVAAARASMSGWSDRLALLLPHGGEALACVGMAAALTAPHLPTAREAVPDRPVAAVAAPAHHAPASGPAAVHSATVAPRLSVDDVLSRCGSGTSLRGASTATLSRARGQMAVDQAEYSRCSSAIDRALLDQRP